MRVQQGTASSAFLFKNDMITDWLTSFSVGENDQLYFVAVVE